MTLSRRLALAAQQVIYIDTPEAMTAASSAPPASSAIIPIWWAGTSAAAQIIWHNCSRDPLSGFIALPRRSSICVPPPHRPAEESTACAATSLPRRH